MTVKQLRSQLESLPDNMPVCILFDREDETKEQSFTIPDPATEWDNPWEKAAYEVEIGYVKKNVPYFDNETCAFETNDVFLLI